MFLSKNAKRFMSTAAVLAMTVASLVVAPKVEAAGEDPTVTVLGATLRIGETQDGTQSMRVGIKVTNADKAKACGIKLNVGKTTVNVSTENPSYQKIYECDEANKTITYTAVITNIPKEKFATNINVQGTTKAITSDIEKNSGDAIGKSVKGIVRELQAIDPTLNLDEQGRLVRGDTPVGKDDLTEFASGTMVYNIGKTLGSFTDGESIVSLESPIKIKKTDKVQVVYSVKSGTSESDLANDTSTPVSIALSSVSIGDPDVNIPYKVWELAELKKTLPAGTQVIDNTMRFTNNYTTIKNIVARADDQATNGKTKLVTIEKILVTPTTDVAISIHAPSGVEVGNTATIKVEIDKDDFDTVKWTSSDDTIATVEPDEADASNGIVTGVAVGDVEITASFKKDGKVVASETVSLSSNIAYKNKAISLPLDDTVVLGGAGTKTISDSGMTINSEDDGVYFPLPYSLAKGDKIEVHIKGSLANETHGFRVYTTAGVRINRGGSNIAVFNKDLPKGQSFDKTWTLTTTEECKCLMIRLPNVWDAPIGNKITGVTISEITVTYK